MTKVLKHILTVETTGEITLLRIPIGIVIVTIELSGLCSMFLTIVLCAELMQKVVGVVACGIPHHGSIGTHLHEELTQVACIDHTKRQRSLTHHVAVVVLHFPRSFCRSKVSTCRVELQIHVVAQLHMIRVRPVYDIVVGIMVATSSHKGPQHISGGRWLQMTCSKQ